MPPGEYRYRKTPAMKSFQDIADAASGWSYQEALAEPDSVRELRFITHARAAIAYLAATGPDDPFPEAGGIAKDFDEARDFGRIQREAITDSAKDN